MALVQSTKMVLRAGNSLPGQWLGLSSDSSPVIDVVVMCYMLHGNVLRKTDDPTVV